LTRDEPRLIIPLLDEQGNLFGFQGRSFKKDSPVKYITIILDYDKPKVYGLDRITKQDPIYVVEGPIDSMFLPNSMASCGGDIIVELPNIDKDKSKFIIVYDNEPRNKDTVRKMDKAIDNGYKVCIWPESVILKDINDMVRSGMTQEKVVDVINDNVYTGLEAKLKMQTWKKV
jgi:DNA primase